MRGEREGERRGRREEERKGWRKGGRERGREGEIEEREHCVVEVACTNMLLVLPLQVFVDNSALLRLQEIVQSKLEDVSQLGWSLGNSTRCPMREL